MQEAPRETLDLVRQWYDVLRTSFGMEVGVVGGGEHVIRPLTVITYFLAIIKLLTGEPGIDLIALGGTYYPAYDSFLGLLTADSIMRGMWSSPPLP